MKREPLIFDFETYFDKQFSLKKFSYPEYIFDPRFSIHLLGVDDGGKHSFIIAKDIPRYLKSVKGRDVIGHNLFFDAAILAWKFNWRASRYIDTLALANHYLGPAKESGSGKNDLDNLAAKLGLKLRKKDMSFMVGVKEPTPGDLLRLEEYLGTDLSMTRQVAGKLLPHLANPEFELWLIDHTLRMYLDKPLAVDPKKLASTRTLVQKLRAERIRASKTTEATLASNPQFAAELRKRLTLAHISLPMKRGKKGMIPALAKDDPAFLKLAESPILNISNLVRGRLVVRSSANVLARLATMERFIERGIPVHLVYYGAHTGRWSSAGGFNFLNLTSPDRANDPVDRIIAAAIRDSIIPGKGEVYVSADAAQIEARVNAWLAGEVSMNEAFAKGQDIYSDFISDVLGERIHKPTGKEPKSVQAHLTLMRGAGKIAVLGLGYNMGVDKFFQQMRSKSPALAKLIDAGKIDLKFAGKVVETFRRKYKHIANLWGVMDTAFKEVFAGGGDRTVGPLRFTLIDETTVGIHLPSGRIMYYRNLRWEKRIGSMTYVDFNGKRVSRSGQTSYELKYGTGKKVYGGLLVENVVQSMSRDILVIALHRAELSKYPVVLHVYDSITVRVPKAKAKKALALLEGMLSKAPPWAKGLVLGAEGHIAGNLNK